VPRNLELKVSATRVQLGAVQQAAIDLGVTNFATFTQIDTYFAVRNGRLKLREIQSPASAGNAELLSYQRANESGSRWSDYRRVELSPDTARQLLDTLAGACGVTVVVEKRRLVGIWGRTRIHLDTVDRLGCFIELETVAGPEDVEDDVRDEHDWVVAKLGIAGFPVVAGSYSDLALDWVTRTDEERKGSNG
jgi:adenylate cyclase class IV